MMQGYDDEFFFEEDKMKKSENVEEAGEKKGAAPGGTADEGTPFLSNDQLPEAELYDGICGEVRSPALGASSTSYFSYETRHMQSFEALERERLGMTVSSGAILIKKDQTNMIGISIGGGHPYCPCLYIVQVFDGTPAAKEGTLQSGDELLGINGASVKGKTKVEVAKMIQGTEKEVKIHYNKLHADPVQGESLDIVLKKVKHRLVENLSSNMADNLGLSRAILCNDSLVMRLKDLEATEKTYRGLVEHAKRMLKAYFDLLMVYKSFGDQFVEMSVREPIPRASESFRIFGEFHRGMEKDGIQMIKALKPVIADFGTYLNKAIPDTKMTIRKYADAKFSYLSYCLKCKEMDDEEHSFIALQEPLYRVETGNYEYRLILRCRQEARAKFAKLRNDVLEKIELLEKKHVRDLAGQLERFIEGLTKFTAECKEKFEPLKGLFPIEIDLKPDAFVYNIRPVFSADGEVGDDDDRRAEVATEAIEEKKGAEAEETAVNLLPGLIEDGLKVSESNGDDLLMELGLADVQVDTNLNPPNSQEFTDFFEFTAPQKKNAENLTQLERDLFGDAPSDLLSADISNPSTANLLLPGLG